MNCRKTSYVAILMLLPVALCISDVFAGDKEMEEIRQLAAVTEKGPEALVKYVQETKVRAPLIYSQWYVDRLAAKNPKRAEIEQARRDFGQKVLESLEATAPALRMPADSQSRQRVANILLDLADWFGEQPGYGNALIFSRLQDMATVPLAHLITDLSYPETNLTAMVGRLVDFPEEVKRNARVLNQEAPESIFATSGKTADEVVNPIERTWYRKVTEVRKWQKNQGKPVIVPSGKKQREELPEDFSFFADDEMSEAPKPFTTLKQWDKKYHRRLFLGLGGHNIRNVKAFLLFRQKVGKFPDHPSFTAEQQVAAQKEVEAASKRGITIVPFEAAYSSPREAAFAQAWEPFRREFGPKYSTAAEVYNAVQSNAFYDEDTRKAKEQESFQQANEALKSRPK